MCVCVWSELSFFSFGFILCCCLSPVSVAAVLGVSFLAVFLLLLFEGCLCFVVSVFSGFGWLV